MPPTSKNRTLHSQFVGRLNDTTYREFVLTVAEFTEELGVPITLTGDNYRVLEAYAQDFDQSRANVFNDVENRVNKMRELAAFMGKLSDNPMADFGPQDSKIMEMVRTVTAMKGLDLIIYESLTSRRARLMNAFLALADGDTGSIEKLAAMALSTEVKVFTAGSLELKIIDAFRAARMGDTKELADLLHDADYSESVAPYIIATPGEPAYDEIRSLYLLAAHGKPEALKMVLSKMGYRLQKAPQPKADTTVTEAPAPSEA